MTGVFFPVTDEGLEKLKELNNKEISFVSLVSYSSTFVINLHLYTFTMLSEDILKAW